MSSAGTNQAMVIDLGVDRLVKGLDDVQKKVDKVAGAWKRVQVPLGSGVGQATAQVKRASAPFDRLNRNIAKITEGPKEQLGEMVRQSDKLDSITHSVKDSGLDIVKTLIPFAAIPLGVNSLVSLMAESSGILSGVFKLQEKTTMIFVKPWADFLGSLMKPYTMHMLKFAIYFNKTVGPALIKLADDINFEIGELFAGIEMGDGFQSIIEFNTKVKEAIAGLDPHIQVLPSIINGFVTMGALAVVGVQDFAKGINGFAQDVQKGIDAVKKVFLVVPAVIRDTIVSAGAGVASAFGAVWTTITSWATNIAENVPSWEDIVTSLTDIWAGLEGGVADLEAGLAGITVGVGGVADELADKISEGVTWANQTVSVDVAKVAGDIAPVIGGAIQWLGQIPLKLAEIADGIRHGIWNGLVWAGDKVSISVTQYAEYLKEAIASGIDWVSDTVTLRVSQFVGDLQSAIASGIQWIGDHLPIDLTAIAPQISGAVVSGLDWVSDQVETAGKAVKDVLHDIASKLGEAWSAVSGVWWAIKEGLDKAWTAVSSAWDKFVQGVTGWMDGEDGEGGILKALADLPAKIAKAISDVTGLKGHSPPQVYAVAPDGTDLSDVTHQVAAIQIANPEHMAAYEQHKVEAVARAQAHLDKLGGSWSLTGSGPIQQYGGALSNVEAAKKFGFVGSGTLGHDATQAYLHNTILPNLAGVRDDLAKLEPYMAFIQNLPSEGNSMAANVRRALEGAHESTLSKLADLEGLANLFQGGNVAIPVRDASTPMASQYDDSIIGRGLQMLMALADQWQGMTPEQAAMSPYITGEEAGLGASGAEIAHGLASLEAIASYQTTADILTESIAIKESNQRIYEEAKKLSEFNKLHDPERWAKAEQVRLDDQYRALELTVRRDNIRLGNEIEGWLSSLASQSGVESIDLSTLAAIPQFTELVSGVISDGVVTKAEFATLKEAITGETVRGAFDEMSAAMDGSVSAFGVAVSDTGHAARDMRIAAVDFKLGSAENRQAAAEMNSAARAIKVAASTPVSVNVYQVPEP